jgi:DNA-binding Lrp family transcriptional regulator
MKKKLPATSIEAYQSLNLQDMRQVYAKILSALAVIGEGTFEDIAKQAKMDKDKIWKRLSELARDKKIHRPGNRKVLSSGRQGYTWVLTVESKIANMSTQEFLDAYLDGKLDPKEPAKVIQKELF